MKLVDYVFWFTDLKHLHISGSSMQFLIQDLISMTGVSASAFKGKTVFDMNLNFQIYAFYWMGIKEQILGAISDLIGCVGVSRQNNVRKSWEHKCKQTNGTMQHSS